MPEDPYAPEYRYGQNQTPGNVNEAQAAPKLTPVEIPTWQLSKLVREIDDFVRAEYQKDVDKWREQVIELGGDIRRYQSEGDELRREVVKLHNKTMTLEAQIGRLVIDQRIIK